MLTDAFSYRTHYATLIITILFLGFFLFPGVSLASGEPTELCDCSDLSALDQDDLRQCNEIIANAFAPQMIQIFEKRDKLDKFVRLDFDDTPNSADNWENADQSLHEDEPWQGYYAVHWVNDAWYITYSYFYPRDWANTFFCNSDEHENDLQRVFMRIERPTCSDPIACEQIDFKSRIQVFTGHHGKLQAGGQCGNPLSFADGAGTHPVVYSSTGSHAMYTNLRDARIDPPKINVCSVNGEQYFQRVDFPNYEPSGSEPSFISDGAKTLERLGSDHYKLVDVTDPEAGIWQYRNNPLVIDKKDPFNIGKDVFHCTDGGGCPNATASAPWNGLGWNPSALDDACHASVAEDQRWVFTSPFTRGNFNRPLQGVINDNLRGGSQKLLAHNVLTPGYKTIEMTFEGEPLRDVAYEQYYGCDTIQGNGELKALVSDSCDHYLFRANAETSCGVESTTFSIKKYQREPTGCRPGSDSCDRPME